MPVIRQRATRFPAVFKSLRTGSPISPLSSRRVSASVSLPQSCWVSQATQISARAPDRLQAKITDRANVVVHVGFASLLRLGSPLGEHCCGLVRKMFVTCPNASPVTGSSIVAWLVLESQARFDLPQQVKPLHEGSRATTCHRTVTMEDEGLKPVISVSANTRLNGGWQPGLCAASVPQAESDLDIKRRIPTVQLLCEDKILAESAQKNPQRAIGRPVINHIRRFELLQMRVLHDRNAILPSDSASV